MAVDVDIGLLSWVFGGKVKKLGEGLLLS